MKADFISLISYIVSGNYIYSFWEIVMDYMSIQSWLNMVISGLISVFHTGNYENQFTIIEGNNVSLLQKES